MRTILKHRILVVVVVGGLAVLLALLLSRVAAAAPLTDSTQPQQFLVLAAGPQDGPGPQAGAGGCCAGGGKGQAKMSGNAQGASGQGRMMGKAQGGRGKGQMKAQAGGGCCGKGAGQGAGGCMGIGSVSAAPADVKLSKAEKAAMDALYIDEHRGRAVYYTIMEKFGNIRPYVNIARSEGCHINALTALYNRYGVETPEVVYETAPDFATVKESLEWSAQFERENAALYDQYLAATDKPDLTNVFTALGNASRYRHLPAFERALSRRR